MHVYNILNRFVKLWSLITCEPLANLPHPATLSSLLLSNLLLVSACQSGRVKLWSVELQISQQSPPTSNTFKKRHPQSHSAVDGNDAVPPLQLPVTEWQLENDAYLTDMALEGDKIFACGRFVRFCG